MRGAENETCVAGYKDGLGVAVAQRLKLAQPSGEHRRDAIKRQLGVDAQAMLSLARCQMFFGVEAQALLQLWQCVGGHCEADGKRVAAETSEKVSAGFDCIEQLKPINRAARAIGHAIFNADHDSGFGSAFDHARGEDADDAAMPAVAVNNQQPIRRELAFHRPAWFQSR